MATASLPNPKDLTRQAPRSPRVRLGGYVIMARMIDKGRAVLQGTNGDYHFDCPLDNALFSFKGVRGEEVKKLLASGATDEAVVAWFNENGTERSSEDIALWSAEQETVTLHGHPEKGGWFDGECQRLGLPPAKTSLFDLLEADDRASFSR